jgi:predicted nucleic acid-binding protein
MAQIVVDASVALKWVLDEPGTRHAAELVGESLHAPDFMLVEVANVLWAKSRRKQLTRKQADSAFDAVVQTPVAITQIGDLLAPARSLGFALDLTLYDCLYVALAQRLGFPLATADSGIADAIEAAALPCGVIRVR